MWDIRSGAVKGCKYNHEAVASYIVKHPEMTTHQLCEALGCGKATVKLARKEYRLGNYRPLMRRDYSGVDEYLAANPNCGLSLNQLAKKFNLPISSLNSHLKLKSIERGGDAFDKFLRRIEGALGGPGQLVRFAVAAREGIGPTKLARRFNITRRVACDWAICIRRECNQGDLSRLREEKSPRKLSLAADHEDKIKTIIAGAFGQEALKEWEEIDSLTGGACS